MQIGIGPQGIIAHLGIVVKFLVRISLGIVATDIPRKSNINSQRRCLSPEHIHIVQRQDVALIGRIGRSGVAERIGMFHGGIQHSFTATQVKAFVDSNLTGMLINAALNDEW